MHFNEQQYLGPDAWFECYRLITVITSPAIKGNCCYVEFLEVDFHLRAMWNGNRVCAMHIAWVVVWVSRTSQGIILY